jgi:hypothetical protein
MVAYKRSSDPPPYSTCVLYLLFLLTKNKPYGIVHKDNEEREESVKVFQ